MTTERKKRNIIVTGVVILIAAIVLSSFVYVNFQKPYAGNVESITLGVFPSEYNSLIYIANDQQYFLANGLKVRLQNYPSGSAAVKGMLNGEVDVATASEFVIVNNAIQNASICAFGSVSKYLNLFLVGRVDKAINNVSDIVGKKIGVTLGTANQFYLGRFLDLNGINHNQVTLVDVTFAETPNALENGTIDAAMTFQPYLNQIKDLLGDKAIVWPAQADQYGFFEAICTKDWATANPDLIIRFLKALVQAENFNQAHEDQAITLVARNLNYSNAYAASVWSDYQYEVVLDQSFILQMQDEARWLISNYPTNTISVPNLLNYIYADGLRSFRPDSVNIIGLGS